MSATVTVVVGARPNFMKAGPVVTELEKDVEVELVHTGQHYDQDMSEAFFEDLGLPRPDVNLGIGSGSHAQQTAGVLIAMEDHLVAGCPDAVVVVGDVNSTLAAALAAAKLNIPVAHVEAGLRSHDWTMPEEVNRVLTDRLSRWLFTPSADADQNLIAEGISPERVHLVGNVMIDTLKVQLPKARARYPELAKRHHLPAEYALLTLHRPSNVDAAAQLGKIMTIIEELSSRVPVLFPMHPRTRERIEAAGVALSRSVITTPPLGYVDFLAVMSEARLVLTDSGGIQEETSVLGVPCITLRERTERPITCTLGTNTVVGNSPERIRAACAAALEHRSTPSLIPLWDGRSAGRIAKVLVDDLLSGGDHLTGEAKRAKEAV